MYYIFDRPIGPKGDTGAKGVNGFPGLRGPVGVMGDRGLKGEIGNIGPKQGLPGIKGPKGNTGIRGVTGDKGVKGLIGETGKKGFQGFQGLKGIAGKRGIKGATGPSRIISNNNDIPLIAYKDKCVYIKSFGNKTPNKLTCPNNMAVFDLKGIKPEQNNDKINIDGILCCRFGLENSILTSHYNFVEVVSGQFGAKINQLLIGYNSKKNEDLSDDEKLLIEKLDLINVLLSRTTKIPSEFLYPLRLLYQLRNDNERFLDEIKIFPKNNIIDLENYLKIE